MGFGQLFHGVNRYSAAPLDSSELTFRNARYVGLPERMIFPQRSDSLSILTAMCPPYALSSLTPRRIGDSSQGIKIEMDIRGRPPDEAAVFCYLKVAPFLRCDFLERRHPIEREFVGLRLARNDDQPIACDSSVRNQFGLSVMPPCGEHAVRDRRVGVHEHIAERAKTGPFQNSGQPRGIDVAPHKKSSKPVLPIHLANEFRDFWQVHRRAKYEQVPIPACRTDRPGSQDWESDGNPAIFIVVAPHERIAVVTT